MRIIVLDDDPVRAESFGQNNPGFQLNAATSARDAIRFLRDQRCDVVFLDHDLDDHRAPGIRSSGTGLEVALWIAACGEDTRPLLTVVHSTNALGSGEMMRVLAEAGCPCLYWPQAWTHHGLMERVRLLLSRFPADNDPSD